VASGPRATAYPVAAMVAAAYRQSWNDRQAVLRAGGLWVLLSLLGDLVTALGGGPAPTAGAPAPSGADLLALPFLLVSWLGLSALTVHRIRAVLLSDPPPTLLAPLDANVARYVLAELVVGALAVLPSLALVPLLAPIGGIGLAVAAGTVAAMLVFARLHLLLAAAALGERGLAIERSWRATGPVWPQAAVGLLACSAPVAMVAGSLGAAIAGAGAPLTGSAVATIAAFAQAAVLGAFLADSRRRLIGPAASGPTPPA